MKVLMPNTGGLLETFDFNKTDNLALLSSDITILQYKRSLGRPDCHSDLDHLPLLERNHSSLNCQAVMMVKVKEDCITFADSVSLSPKCSSSTATVSFSLTIGTIP